MPRLYSRILLVTTAAASAFHSGLLEALRIRPPIDLNDSKGPRTILCSDAIHLCMMPAAAVISQTYYLGQMLFVDLW